MNRVYYTLQLFLLSSPPVEKPSVELQVARFLARLVVGIATVMAALTFFWRRAQLFRVRWFARKHSVIVGLGSAGSQLARALDDRGRSVVVIEKDPLNAEVAGLVERRIPVLHGDATDPVVLKQAGLKRAAHLVATCGDDSTNVNVVFAAQEGPAEGRPTPLEALAHIDDPEVRAALQARAVELWACSTVLLECFNVFEDAAAEMLREHPFQDHVAKGSRRSSWSLASASSAKPSPSWRPSGGTRIDPRGPTPWGSR